MAIKWADNSFAKTRGVDPEQAIDVLEEIRIRDGLIKPSAVVEAAEPKSSPLHPAFEWRNGVAAQRYREWQARSMVKAIIVVDDQTNQKAPAFVNISRVDDEGEKQRGYQRTEIAITRPDEWLEALGTFNAKITSARSSLEQLEQLAAGSEQKDRLASIAIAAKALDTARAALSH